MFVRVLVQVLVVVSLMTAVGAAVMVGRDRLAQTRREWLGRLREVTPAVIVLLVVLWFNGQARQNVPEISWMLDWNVTWLIYELEGEFIVWLQGLAAPAITAYFSFVYIYGYVFLMVFSGIAYFALSDTRPFRELMTAYTLNYVVGLAIYVLLIAFGPRNVMPELVDALLYDTYPEYQHLTRQVNRNTNVFPSLHTSLAATVTFLAYRTRAAYPRWYRLAVGLGVSIALSTMYLGIHWATDVVAGIVLAWVSVALASRLVGRWSISAAVDRWRGRRTADPPARGAGTESTDTGDAAGEESAVDADARPRRD